MLSGFKQFILRGNVVDMAVGVVIGAAFATVVTAFTKDLLTPLIAAIVGKPDFSAISFTNRQMRFRVAQRFQRCDKRIPKRTPRSESQLQEFSYTIITCPLSFVSLES